jgi:hypothetical protein
MVLGMSQSKWFDPITKPKKKKDYPKLIHLVNWFQWVRSLVTYLVKFR